MLTDTGDEGEGLSLLVHTLVAISSHDYAAAEETGRRALEVFRAPNHRWGVTTSLLVLARIANNRRSGTLQQLLQESAPLVTSGNDLGVERTSSLCRATRPSAPSTSTSRNSTQPPTASLSSWVIAPPRPRTC